MTDLNEYLAVEVMGWRLLKSETYGKAYKTGKSGTISKYIPLKDWNPRENIEQAVMCLSFLDDNDTAKLSTQSGKYFCSLTRFHKNGCIALGGGSGITYAEAISLAVARAARWEDD